MDWTYPDTNGASSTGGNPQNNMYRAAVAATPAEVKDFLFQWLDDNVLKKYNEKRSTTPVFSVIFNMFFVVAYAFVLLGYIMTCGCLSGQVMDKMGSYSVVQTTLKLLLKIPNVFFAISLIFMAYMANMTGYLIGSYSLFLTGILFAGVSMYTPCKRWLLLVAGIILCIYSVLHTVTVQTLFSNWTMLTSLFRYTTVVSVILILIDGFVTVPKCMMQKMK